MYTLRLLGTASIEDANGFVTGRAGQGRRLALLALLALARGRPLSRDKLVALLWPDASPERARPQLSDTLYILRSTLGDDVISATGDVLTLDTAAIECDVCDFERLLAAGDPEQAVAQYRGPLLDGFHLSASVEFESWLDGERRSLERQYAQALEALATAASARGAVEEAVAWWRRCAVHDPHNGRVALGLMAALDAAGDRAGALQHARIHSTLLREEFDAEPDAELVAFTERLRAAPTPAVPVVQATSLPNVAAAAEAAPVTAAPVAEPVAAVVAAPAPVVLTGRGWRRSVVVAVLAVVVLSSLALTVVLGRRGADAPAPARSVGVLPFVNMSPDPANTYFSDGLSEQIILALSHIDGLRVAARTSSFALRNRELDVRAIADTLDVQAVLEGSVLVDGERMRVIAQLIDARTGYHIWADQFDGDVRDAFALQDRVALAIANALHLHLAAQQRTAGAPSLEAYDAYLRGLHLRHQLSADALQQAARYFDRTIELEPRFAQGWAAKASALAPQAYFRYANRDSVVTELRRLTARALELDPESSEAHTSLGVIQLFYEWNWQAAHAALQRAIELNPNDAYAWHHLGNYHAATASVQGAIAAREQAVRLDPLNGRPRILLSRDYLLAHSYDRALEQARRAAQLDPLNPLLLGLGPSLPAGEAEVLLRQGREEEAVEQYIRIATLRDATPAELQAMRTGYAASGMTGFWQAWLAMDLRQAGPSPDPFRMAVTHLCAGDTAQSLAWLERAFEERHPAMIYLRRDAVLATLRDHPRVQRIARLMKFPAVRR